jgi:DHA1 family multidrug resistance protein-like MFS transporter
MKTQKKNLFILAFAMVVVTLGFGLVIPIIPFYMESMGAGGTELGLLVASYAIMRLFFGPIWGSISDRIGRKPVMIIGIFGYAITMLFFGLANQLWMLFAARSLSGILSSATSPTTMAYISDSTPEKERSGGMGIIGAAMGIGTIIGPGIGGILAKQSLSFPFYIAAAIAMIAMLLIILFLPESLSPENRKNKPEKIQIFPVRAIGLSFKTPLGFLLFLAFLISLAGATFSGIFGLYAFNKFSFGPQEVGAVLMGMAIISAAAQGLLTGILTKILGDTALIKIALCGTSIGLLFIIFSSTSLHLYLSLGLFILMLSILSPTINALTSKQIIFEPGMTMGLSNSFISLGRIVGPGTAGFLYDYNHELPYLLCAIVIGTGFLSSLWWKNRDPLEKY